PTRVLVLQTGWDDLALSESVAVNGVCLSVTELTAGGHCDVLRQSRDDDPFQPRPGWGRRPSQS
ncbi:MAG: hypothetical protein MO852_00450, partial [Candidatus Devosia euplotis]|nr:hypothetical protein [Candidatus Devosia euplotis]